MVEHGGNLDAAIAQFGGERTSWIDLSTGINPHAYPVSDIPHRHWADLPDASALNDLISAARTTYNTQLPILPMAGAQQAINAYPVLKSSGDARILSPTYNEHGLQLAKKGWQVTEVSKINALCGADLAVIVNPNNPDGQCFASEDILAVAQTVGLLIVDESFVDAHPDLSICHHVNEKNDNVLILRSFGKFYGLAGLRLGFAIGAEPLLQPLASHQGSWAVSGPALYIGASALNDVKWAEDMRLRLQIDAQKLDKLAAQAGWILRGGCSLFRLYEMDNADQEQQKLANHHIWSRRFSYAPRWIRLGLPPADKWTQLENAFSR